MCIDEEGAVIYGRRSRQIMSSYEEATADSSVGSPKMELCMDQERLRPGQSAHCCVLQRRKEKKEEVEDERKMRKAKVEKTEKEKKKRENNGGGREED